MSPVLLAAVTLVAISPGTGVGETVVRLHVNPMPEPKPAFKYHLLPEVHELTPGNAAQNYLKCFMEQRIFFFSERGIEERTRYSKMSLTELAAAKIRGYGGNALREADRAARMVGIDWQTVLQNEDGGFTGLPAELGPLQVLAESLNVRFRAEIAERQFEDAVRTAKTMFALGRHLGEYPAELANQVGISVAHLGLVGLKEMVQQPGCPNLYWALADLPCPLVDLRKGVQGDRTLATAQLEPIRGDAVMTDAEIETCVIRLSGVLGFIREQAGRPPRSLRTRLTALANDSKPLGDARRRLVEAGSDPKLVQSMPPLQVILLDEKLAFEIQRDEQIKLLILPLWQIPPSAGGNAQPTDQGRAFDAFLPRVGKLRRVQGALEQEVALLRHVEALRFHAAGHSGHLPASLSEISEPLPADPFTGKPFDYKVEEATAQLRGGAPRSEEDSPGSGILYEVILKD